MKGKETLDQLKKEIDSARVADRQWYLDLLDDEKQRQAEEYHLEALLALLRHYYLSKEQGRIAEAKRELGEIRAAEDYSAEAYARTVELNETVRCAKETLESYRHFFAEPYFARMDTQDEAEGYNAYYIGKKGDLHLGIVDWRAPLARRYYQKSQRCFSINGYDYTVILRRAIRVADGRLESFRNEYLSVRDVLTREEIDGRDEEIVLDPYLREIIRARKNEESVRDIIESIQEKQFDLITRPERESFVVQGCAGSGKTMVLLHRLSYMMYNNEELRPRDVLVITPSHSFNEFIDELSQVLELGKVSTVTLQDYFLAVLRHAGLDVGERLNGAAEDERYLRYVYSEEFCGDTEKTLSKIYASVHGMFDTGEWRVLAESVLAECAAQKAAYEKIKNASVRPRRAVLGEIREDENGNLRYTKPFRGFMNGILQAEEFLRESISGDSRSQWQFYRQLAAFFRAAQGTVRDCSEVVGTALSDLNELEETLRKEIKELQRHRTYRFGREEYDFAEGIRAREEILREKEEVAECVRTIGGKCERFTSFFGMLEKNTDLYEIGSCESDEEIIRWFYRRIVKTKKKELGMTGKGMYAADVYALLSVLAAMGHELGPHYSWVFIDEGQDISPSEYALLRKINRGGVFNVYGDLKQNITPWRGVSSWEQAFPGLPVYTLDQNYRNSNQIVQFVSEYMDADMHPIGFDGAPVLSIGVREIGAFFRDKQGIKALIAVDSELEFLRRGSYNFVRESGTLSKKKVNLMSVYESKGLEFAAVAVYDKGMSENERYIAFTRALDSLAVVRPVKERQPGTGGDGAAGGKG